MDASVFLEKLDDKRAGVKPWGLCATCGEHQPAPGFAMCVICRAKIGLGSDEEVRAASEAKARAENERHMRALQVFVNRTATPIKEVTMSDKTYAYPCPMEKCDGGGKSAQGLRIHGAKAHGGSAGVKQAISARITEIESKDEQKVLETKPPLDPARTTTLPDTTILREIVEQGGPVLLELSLADMRMELVNTKLELVIQRLVFGQFEECERMVDDLDRVRELLQA